MADETDDSNTEPESQLEALLAEADLSIYSEEVRRDVERLLAPGQALEPGARTRFVAAANRAVHDLGLQATAAIETLLFNARTAQSQTLDKIASAIGGDAAVLRSIERGDAQLKELDASLLARWAISLELDRDTIENGVRNSLSRAIRARTYARAGLPQLTDDDTRFLEEVLRQIDVPTKPDTSE